MRFDEAYAGWQAGRLRQEEAARLLGVCARTFRRYLDRYEADGIEGLIDRRLQQLSHRRAPVDEVLALTHRYRQRHQGWCAKHYFAWYRRDGGTRSYTWVKRRLQEAQLVPCAPRRGAHRTRRDRAPLPGMLLHQDGSRHEWVSGQRWDLVVTRDAATSEHYAMQFVAEEGTHSSFHGVAAAIRSHGLFSALYTDRGSHYWFTPKPGGKVDMRTPTQFGRALQQLGIEMIAAYSPQARGRSERAFRTHQRAWCANSPPPAGITDMSAANRCLEEYYRPAFNAEFAQPSLEPGCAFVPWAGGTLDDILCEQFERRVGADNCVTFGRLTLQIPRQRHRCHFVKLTVRVHRYLDDTLAIFHGPRSLARDTADNQLIEQLRSAA